MSFSKKVISVMITAIMCSSAMAQETPDRPSISFGYQRGSIKDFGDIQGGNMKFHYENASPWGVMGSVTAMKKDWDNGNFSLKFRNKKKGNPTDKKNDIRNALYFSAMIGPTYRVSDKISFFVLGGIAHSKVDNPLIFNPGDADHKPGNVKNGSESSDEFAYTAGMTVNATDNLSLTVGYEGAQAAFNTHHNSMKSMYLDVGYRF